MTHPALAPHRARCTTCGDPILWATSNTSGKPHPINAQPHERGNVLLYITDHVLYATVLNRAQAAGAQAQQEPLYTSHFANCPHAEGHRKNRR